MTLETYGYAQLHPGSEAGVTLRLSGLDPDTDPDTHTDAAVVRQLSETGSVIGVWPQLSAYPEELATLLGLGCSIDHLTLLNDHDHSEHRGPLGFAEIAAYLQCRDAGMEGGQ